MPGGKCGRRGLCKTLLFSLPSPVSSSPPRSPGSLQSCPVVFWYLRWFPLCFDCPFYLPWFPPKNVGFADMGRSRVFPVIFSPRAVSLQELKSGSGRHLFLLCSSPTIRLQCWLVPLSSKVQWASFPAWTAVATPSQVSLALAQAQNQPENFLNSIIWDFIDFTQVEPCQGQYEIHVSSLKL